mmetsp:Transcript_55120/g.165116  ORF Transcript_55120/g.165116 Transcript_55120/m.165116 type:complete len:214 (+) Transcript_55120:302-943(+)
MTLPVLRCRRPLPPPPRHCCDPPIWFRPTDPPLDVPRSDHPPRRRHPFPRGVHVRGPSPTPPKPSRSIAPALASIPPSPSPSWPERGAWSGPRSSGRPRGSTRALGSRPRSSRRRLLPRRRPRSRRRREASSPSDATSPSSGTRPNAPAPSIPRRRRREKRRSIRARPSSCRRGGTRSEMRGEAGVPGGRCPDCGRRGSWPIPWRDRTAGHPR